MSQRSSRSGKRDRDSGLPSSSFTTKSATTGPYNPQFEQILIDNGVYPDGYRGKEGGRPPKPQNSEDIRHWLSLPRLSLSPSSFSEGASEDFQDDDRRAASEQDVMTNVMPAIIEAQDIQHYSSGNIDFNNLEKFHPSLKTAKPDSSYGSYPEEIDRRVRSDLAQYIVPSTTENRPAPPNYLVEVKGASGRSDVLQRQAMHVGAIGVRSMFQLQNYGNETPAFDGNAYSYTSTYHAGEGSLRIHATHPTQSATGETKYYMTPLWSYAMTDTSDSFRQGAAAYRNIRDLSKEQRDRFIAEANATAQSLPTAASQSSATGSTTEVSSASESDTSTDELAHEYDQPSRRQRRRIATPSSSYGSANVRQSQTLQITSATSSAP